MNYNSEYFISLINNAIHSRKASLPKESNIDWTEIYINAKAHNLLAVLYPVVESLSGKSSLNKELLDTWKKETIALGAAQMSKNFSLENILIDAAEENITIIAVKGVILAGLYPEYLLRVSGDVDILINQEDKLKVHNILCSHGYKMDMESSIDCEVTYRLGNLHTVELHTRLWEEKDGRKLELLENLNLTSNCSLININTCDMSVTTLGYTEHLVYLIYHMVKHFFISGIGVRHLTDITLYINNYYSEIDFIRFWDNAKLMGYYSFCLNIFQICIERFEMNSSIMENIDFSYEKTICDKMLEDIIDAGVFGGKSTPRWKSGRILRLYYENEDKRVPSSKLSLLFAFLFPKTEELTNQRIDKVKYSKILPIAWFQRVFYLFRKWKNDSDRCSLKSRINCASKRISLLKDLDLIK